MARRGFRDNQGAERVATFGPQPHGSANAHGLDLAYGLALGARAGVGGVIRIGERSSPGVGRYTGLLGPQQSFRGAASMGASNTLRRSMAAQQAFPSTHGPIGSPNPVLDLIGRTQQRR